MPAQLPKLNASQQDAIDAIWAFVNSATPLFLLLGSAGTGKTTLIKHITGLLDEQSRPFQLLAPTGRAARILGARTQRPSSTIHGHIYALPQVDVFEAAESPNDPGMRWYFPLKHDDSLETIFIVDESSMVGDKEAKRDVLRFGSGRLLKDLIEFARLGRIGRSGEFGSKIIFVGDPAQLPPVGETLSPALSRQYVKEYFDLECEQLELTEVMRQQAGSAVLDRATALRDAIGKRIYSSFDISADGNDIVDASISEGVVTAERAFGFKSSCVLITYSNAEALKLNRAIRGQILGGEDADLRSGDLLLVNRNSYKCNLSNGDLFKVKEVDGEPIHRSVCLKVRNGERVEKHTVSLTFRVAVVVYKAADQSPSEMHCMLLENLLHSEERELTPLEQRALLVDFRKRHPHLRPKTDAFNLAIRDDPYFNALQVKYGYAMTCHKSQGGEWETAIVHFGGGRGTRNEDFFRWAYTAITRAKRKLFTIGAPNFSATSSIDWRARSATNRRGAR
jgi:ATP-dependent exoDNAse (exonuclease V) alpha subunit